MWLTCRDAETKITCYRHQALIAKSSQTYHQGHDRHQAAIAALEGPWEPVEAMVAEFRRRRAIVVSGLNDLPGVSCLEP